MRVIVTGGRDWTPVGHNPLYRVLDELKPTVLIQGGCPTGADFWARQYARDHDLHLGTFYADWKKHGRSAGPKRNSEMVNAGADVVVACPGGKGTEDCTYKARLAGIRVVEVGPALKTNEIHTPPR